MTTTLKSPQPLRIGALAFTAATLLSGAGCFDGGLLEVESGVTDLDAVRNAGGFEALRAGAIQGLGGALGGIDSWGLIVISGALTDEFVVARGGTGIEAIDKRTVDAENEEGHAAGPFGQLSMARLGARQTLDALMSSSSQRQDVISEMYSFLAFLEGLLGETYCSGIPLSEVQGGTPVFGKPLTSEEVFSRALSHADTALAAESGPSDAAYLARIVRGRILLNLDRPAEAAETVTDVPTDYTFQLQFSSAATAVRNPVFGWIGRARIFSVSDSEGVNGLDFRSAQDPRLKVVYAGLGQDGVTEVWSPEKYHSDDAPIVVASGVEARLIQAEAALAAGNRSEALAILNALRAQDPELSPLEDPGTTEGLLDLVFRERAFWLFGTAHRLGDLRRIVRHYGRSVEETFPVGPYFRGGDYGTEVTLPIPQQERNNPLGGVCLSRNP